MMKKDTPQLTKILFLDIETVAESPKYDDLNLKTQELWSKKASQIKKYSSDLELMTDAEVYEERAGIYAEFGKIIVISVGRVDEEGEIHLSSYAWHDEMKLLAECAELLDKHYAWHKHFLCGHNAREFDIPYLCRRMKIHGIKVPKIMPTPSQKPRDSKVLDTMEMWKYGDRKAYTSLDLLCNVFNIPSPKWDINGADVSRVYRETQDVERIQEYCERDVVALIEVYKRLI